MSPKLLRRLAPEFLQDSTVGQLLDCNRRNHFSSLKFFKLNFFKLLWVELLQVDHTAEYPRLKQIEQIEQLNH